MGDDWEASFVAGRDGGPSCVCHVEVENGSGIETGNGMESALWKSGCHIVHCDWRRTIHVTISTMF